MKGQQTLFSGSSDEWSTPEETFQTLDAEFHFTLDPCATDQNHKCTLYYTQEENGLLQNWGGKACSAIRHIVKLGTGLRRHIVRPAKTIHWLCC